MNNHAQPAAIAATAIVSIAIGYGAATWFASTRVEDKPIINPTAWEETAPAPQVQTVSYTNTAQGDVRAAAHCSPWEVSDIAMEEVLDEMIRRGWRPPNQGQAVAAMGVPGFSVADPYAPMPYGRSWSSSPSRSDEAEDAYEAEALPAAAEPRAMPATPAVSAPALAPQPVAIEQPPQAITPRPEG